VGKEGGDDVSRLENMIDRAERRLHDRYFDPDDSDAETTNRLRRNDRLERMADDENDRRNYNDLHSSHRDNPR
jgi:hypothetical protein